MHSTDGNFSITAEKEDNKRLLVLHKSSSGSKIATQAGETRKTRALMAKQEKYEVKKENGQITEITRYTPSGGEWKPYEQYVFEYNDTEISPSRYAAMINYFITNHGGNYYYYNWY